MREKSGDNKSRRIKVKAYKYSAPVYGTLLSIQSLYCKLSQENHKLIIIIIFMGPNSVDRASRFLLAIEI